MINIKMNLQTLFPIPTEFSNQPQEMFSESIEIFKCFIYFLQKLEIIHHHLQKKMTRSMPQNTELYSSKPFGMAVIGCFYTNSLAVVSLKAFQQL